MNNLKYINFHIICLRVQFIFLNELLESNRIILLIWVALLIHILSSLIQFQASSWKNLILKVCRGAYPPLPGHLPYELHYLLKQMFKTNPKDRPSVHTILTSHRASRLLRAHLPAQVTPPPLFACSEVLLPRGRASCC